MNKALTRKESWRERTNLLRNCTALLLAFVAFPMPGLAQTEDTVTFRFNDGGGITGELVESNDVSAKLRTSIGLITVPLDGASCVGVACPASVRFVAVSQPVVLTALDGSMRLSGSLLEVTEDQYVIATDFGEVQIDIDKARCDGEGCPANADEPQFGKEVVLTNGTTTIEGRLIGLTEKAYVIEEKTLGIINISSEEFTCTGEGCL